MKRFQGGLVRKAHRLVYHSTLGSRVIKKKKKTSERKCGNTGKVGGDVRDRILALRL